MLERILTQKNHRVFFQKFSRLIVYLNILLIVYLNMLTLLIVVALSQHSRAASIAVTPRRPDPVDCHFETALSTDHTANESLMSVTDKYTFYGIIQSTTMALMKAVQSEQLMHKICEKGHIVVTWKDGPTTESIPVLGLTQAMAYNPFLIVKALVDKIRRWNSHHRDFGVESHHKLQSLIELSDLLQEFDDEYGPNRMHFRRLYDLLRITFPLQPRELEMDSTYSFCYYWGYYHKYIGFIAKNELSLDAVFGESSTSVVFKVRSRHNTEIVGEQMFALKIYEERDTLNFYDSIEQHSDCSHSIATHGKYGGKQMRPICCYLMQFINGSYIQCSRYMI